MRQTNPEKSFSLLFCFSPNENAFLDNQGLKHSVNTEEIIHSKVQSQHIIGIKPLTEQRDYRENIASETWECGGCWSCTAVITLQDLWK